jgi:fucose permease
MKILFRAIVFLAMLFAFLYVGINNTHLIDFSFPILLKKNIQATAALIYFAMFAIGLVAGLALGSGGKKSRPASESKR